MREIDESKHAKNFTAPLAAIALIIGIVFGYAYQASEISELQDSLQDLRTKVSQLTAREKVLSADLTQANQIASNSSSDSRTARHEMEELHKELSRIRAQTKATEQSLQATISSLRQEIIITRKLAIDSAKVPGPDVSRESDKPNERIQINDRLLAKDLAISRNKELLEKFTLVSYESKGSAVYRHTYLENWRKIKPVSIIASLFLADVTVDSEGNRHSVPFKYLTVQHGNELLSFSKIDGLKDYFSGHEIGQEKLRCVLRWDGVDYMNSMSYPAAIKYYTGNGVNTVEVELDRDYANALRETFELSESFKTLNRLKGN